MSAPRVVYCHCAYAKVVPAEVKQAVLDGLGRSGAAFEAVPDLCEMSARKDPALGALAADARAGEVRIAACYPRAVRWLFHAAKTPLPDAGVEVLNMRDQTAEHVVARALSSEPVESSWSGTVEVGPVTPAGETY